MTDPAGSASVGGATIDPAQTYGYARPPQQQKAFDQAAAQLVSSDGWAASAAEPKELVADLALEGGGVKGIAIVGAVSVLAEAGYRFPRVAGTSAGAIAATLIAAISKAGKPMSSLKGYLDSLSFMNFMPEGKIHHFLDHHLGKAGGALSDATILSHQMGLYPGGYLAEWLGPILQDDLGVRTFGDLKITLDEDPGMSLPESRRYRLVVHTSDITRGELARLPWDFNYYGHDRRSCLGTMMNEWDAYNVDESTAARTIFVNNAGLTATDFDLTTAQQNQLFLNGVDAATAFLIEMAGRGRVPRSAHEARALFSSAP